jgi:hypothetical protein
MFRLLSGKHSGPLLFLFFKLEEEEGTALLLYLLKVFAETAVFGSASFFGCRLVVATAQAAILLSALFLF